MRVTVSHVGQEKSLTAAASGVKGTLVSRIENIDVESNRVVSEQ